MNSHIATDHPGSGNSTGELALNGASLQLPAAFSDRWLGDIHTVGVLVAADCLRIYPVHDAAQGGRLLKIRNAKGDRVVHVGDLLQDLGIPTRGKRRLAAYWDEAQGAVVARLDDLPHATGEAP